MGDSYTLNSPVSNPVLAEAYLQRLKARREPLF